MVTTPEPNLKAAGKEESHGEAGLVKDPVVMEKIPRRSRRRRLNQYETGLSNHQMVDGIFAMRC